MKKIKLELTHKEMILLYSFGVTAMNNHMKDFKTVSDKEYKPLSDKLWEAYMIADKEIKNNKESKIKEIIEDLQYCSHSIIQDSDKLRMLLRVSPKNELNENIRGSLRENQLGHLEKDLKKLARQGKLELVFDDEYLHIGFYMMKYESQQLIDELELWG